LFFNRKVFFKATTWGFLMEWVPALSSLALLAFSSAIMIVAWYAHLNFSTAPLWKAILGSWLIAFFEYSLQVPANRIGHRVFSAAQLRVFAELFTLIAFAVFSTTYLKEPLSTNSIVSFVLVFLAVVVAVMGPFK
jgi:uncharacterized protein